jgi:hypothetical protein
MRSKTEDFEAAKRTAMDIIDDQQESLRIGWALAKTATNAMDLVSSVDCEKPSMLAELLDTHPEVFGLEIDKRKWEDNS